MKHKKKGYAMGGAMKKKGYAMGGAMKKKGMAAGGRTTMGKQMMANGGATMSLAKIKAAAKAKGYKLIKE